MAALDSLPEELKIEVLSWLDVGGSFSGLSGPIEARLISGSPQEAWVAAVGYPQTGAVSRRPIFCGRLWCSEEQV